MDKGGFIIGVSGRSGSGKSTLVKKILDHYGDEDICLHTMDNYYLPREQQMLDDNQYLNFDLPTSFYRERFHKDLLLLKEDKTVEIEEYAFNNEKEGSALKIKSAPIILVEGLFVYHYEEIRSLLDYKIMMDVTHDTCYKRRLKRDTLERNYSEAEINYRYNSHVEPSYLAYIKPYLKEVDLYLENEKSMDEGWKIIQQIVEHRIK